MDTHGYGHDRLVLEALDAANDPGLEDSTGEEIARLPLIRREEIDGGGETMTAAAGDHKWENIQVRLRSRDRPSSALVWAWRDFRP